MPTEEQVYGFLADKPSLMHEVIRTMLRRVAPSAIRARIVFTTDSGDRGSIPLVMTGD